MSMKGHHKDSMKILRDDEKKMNVHQTIRPGFKCNIKFVNFMIQWHHKNQCICPKLMLLKGSH